METVKETIAISMEEYKELIMIKGKYEELKSLFPYPIHTYPKTNITYRDFKDPWKNEKDLTPPYKITCEESNNIKVD